MEIVYSDLLYHRVAPLTQFYGKSIGDLTCAGPVGLTQAGPEKAVRPRTRHLFI